MPTVISSILFLEGVPNLQYLGKLNIGEDDVEEILRSDLKLELDGAKDLREEIAYMDSVRDYVSRDLLIKILADEEEYIDWIETELDLIACLGLPNYLQVQLKKRHDSVKRGCFLNRFTYNALARLN